MRALMLLGALGWSTVAAAAQPAIRDEGARVAVSVPGAHAAATAAVAHGDAIELELTAPVSPLKAELEDETIKRMEIVGGARPRLILKLHHGRHTTERLAAATTVLESGGALRVSVPREAEEIPGVAPLRSDAPVTVGMARPEVRETPSVTTHAAPTTTTAAAVAAAVPAAAPLTETRPIATPPAPGADVAAALATGRATPPLLDPIAEPTTTTTTTTTTTGAKSTTPPLPWVIGALAVAAALTLLARRRGRAADPTATLRVLASQSLGGRSRLVLVASEGHHILLSVNDSNTRVVARYEADGTEAADAAADASGHDEERDEERHEDRPAERDNAHHVDRRLERYTERFDDDDAAAAAPTPPRPARAGKPSRLRAVATPASSPAVAGLLKLRSDSPSEGPSQWGDVLRRAAGRVKQ